MAPVGDGRSGRRPLLLGLVGGTAALGAATVVGRVAGRHDDEPGPGGALLLTAESDDMAAATLVLDGDLLEQVGEGEWTTAKLATSTHSMAAVTWTGSAEPEVSIRSRTGGGWTSWQRLTTMHDGPDDDSGEGSGVHGTELVWTGDADGIQVRAAGRLPAGLTLTLLRPARLAGDADAAPDLLPPTASMRTTAGAAARTASMRPALRSRAAWGADESLRSGSAQFCRTIQQAHVHHSASGTDYASADVPALIRGFYRYHTVSLGWSDLGYNFLVDRFGRVWVGRAGGADKAVRGAHTLGFNATSVGICVIGNFETATPGAKVLQSVAAVAAWKLQGYGMDPAGTVQVLSEGSDRYKSGRTVGLPVIDGHRDTNDTACPGKNLYARLGDIRQRAAVMVRQGTVAPSVRVTAASTLSGAAVVGKLLRVTPGTFSPTPASTTRTWFRNGVPIPGARGVTYRLRAEDLGASVSVQVAAASPGYTTSVETLATPAVRAKTLVKAQVHQGADGTTVKVVARGRTTGPRASGPVTVRIRKTRRTAVLNNGVATVRFPNIAGGPAQLRVSYPGDTWLMPAKLGKKVRIRKR